MASNVIDSFFYRDHFSTEEMRNVFSDENMVQKWLDVEAALAKVQAKLKIIPQEAAEEIAKKANVALIDFSKLKQELDLTGHPFVPLIRVFKSLCEGNAGEYIHWGATTQDIMDNAFVLQIKEAFTIIIKKINQLYSLLCERAEEFKELTVMGRTNGQHALPITLGFKYAVWAAEIERSIERLKESEQRLFTGQFSGAVGTMASLGEEGIPTQQLLLKELELEVPDIAWHSSRDNFVEFAQTLGIIAGTVGKIANELYELQKPEFGEVIEESGAESVGSSTMPHKRNPFNVMQVVSLSKIILATVSESYYTLNSEHERDARTLMIEWEYMSRICCMTDAALKKINQSLSKIKPVTDSIKKNIKIQGDLISSEKVMMQLSDIVGRQKAHDIIHDASMKAIKSNSSLKSQLLQKEEVVKHFSEEQLDSYLDPQNYTGKAVYFVENVTKK